MKKTKLRISVCVALVSALVFSSAAVSFAGTIDASYNNIKISVNGTTVTPKDAAGNTVEPFIYNGTTYLPVRAVSSMLGNEVSWDNAAKTVKISTNAIDYPKVFSDFWGAYKMLEGAKQASNMAVDILGNSSLQTDANINKLLSSIEEQLAISKKSREGAFYQMQPVIKGYAACDAALGITYDNLKAIKSGDSIESYARKELINNNGIFSAQTEISTAILEILNYANQ